MSVKNDSLTGANKGRISSRFITFTPSMKNILSKYCPLAGIVAA
jgi:hypothetical protein